MTGWERKDKDIGIGVEFIPSLKKPCLVIREGNRLVKVASFNNAFAAAKFLNSMAEIFNLPNPLEVVKK